jgi:hypothetical protein
MSNSAKKGTGPICRDGPEGAAHKLDLSPFSRLLTGLLDDELDAADRQRLVETLRGDPAARTHYLQYLLTDAMLRLEHTAPAEVGNERRPADLADSSPLIPPIVLDTSPAGRSLVGGFLFSYGVAALILGIALLAGWTRTISRDRGVVPAGRPATHDVAVRPPSVGRITAAVGCVWAERAATAAPQDDVLAGREYALQSGFLEIAYHSGVRVILEGPVRYEVGSSAGGFLARGKLTARVESRESRVESKTPDAPSPSGSRLSTQGSQLFTVRTPTAVVSDLGTEFGVEVDSSGTTYAHVFQGKVELSPREDGRQPAGAIALETGQSAAAAMDSDRRVRVTRGDDELRPIVFVRRSRDGGPFQWWAVSGLRRWQIIAHGDDPEIQWQVRVPYDGPAARLPQHGAEQPAADGVPAESGRLSAVDDRSGRPVSSTCINYEFRLAGDLPEKAILWAQVRGDIGIDRVRLNGTIIGTPRVPPHSAQKIVTLTGVLDISRVLTKGRNTLTFDITRDRSAGQAESKRSAAPDRRKGARGSQ